MRTKVSSLPVTACSLLFFAAPVTEALQEESRYVNPIYGWSVSRPRSWNVNDGDPSFVRILSSEGNALCGIHSGSVRFETLDEFTDFMLQQTERLLKQRGLVPLVSARRRISLPNGISGNDMLVDVHIGGRSRRIFVLVHGRGYALECETHAKNWAMREATFDAIMRSFTLGK